MGYFMGVSTRLMGALIMTHSDDNGLVLPPHLPDTGSHRSYLQERRTTETNRCESRRYRNQVA